MDWSNLKEDYERLGSYNAVAAEYGCSVSAVQKAIARAGIKPKLRGVRSGYVWTPEHRAAHRAAVDSPEWRAKSRENLLKRLPTMRGPSANSPLEKLLQAALRKSGIGFSTQRVLLSRYCVDILINQAPVIIEADGALHFLRKQEDAERDAALKEAGYLVFRFTGARINRDSMECVLEVADACGLQADAEPEYDIRTGMMGEENPNWTGGPQDVVCTSCGKLTQRNKFQTQWKKMFCDSQCYGSWMSKHPEESNRAFKIDWSKVAELYQADVPPQELMDQFSIGKTTLYRHLKKLGVEPVHHCRSPQ